MKKMIAGPNTKSTGEEHKKQMGGNISPPFSLLPFFPFSIII
jgi:hypothetical protein